MDIDQKNPWIVSEVEQFLFFCCPECDVKDRSKENFIQHALNHHPNAKKGLGIDSLVKEEFEDHEINNDYLEQSMEEYSEIPLYECETCKIGLSSASELKFHVREDHENFTIYKGYSCKFCNEHFEYWPGLLHHIGEIHEGTTKEEIKTESDENVHEGNKKDNNIVNNETENTKMDPKKITRKQKKKKCPKCEKLLVNRVNRHLISCTGEDVDKDKVHKVHKCDICEKSYSKLGNLKIHMSNAHDVQIKEENSNLTEKVQCDQCEKTFSTNERLKNHVKFVHEKAGETFCDLCGKAFSRYKTLETHKRIVHEGKKDHICEFCQKSFSVRSNLVQHIKMVHQKERNHICDECGMTFCSAFALKNHVQNIHEKIKHYCEECGKGLSSKHELQEHINCVHKGESNHQCKICMRKYTRRNCLRRHIKITHPEVENAKSAMIKSNEKPFLLKNI